MATLSKLTLLDLLQTVRDFAKSDDEIVATVTSSTAARSGCAAASLGQGSTCLPRLVLLLHHRPHTTDSLSEAVEVFLMRHKKMAEYGLRVCSALLLFTLFLFSSTSAQAALSVEWQEGRLSVSAERAPLAQILQEVARRTGMEVRGLEGLQEQVSVRFAGLPLHEGLQRLHVNYVVVWKTSSQGDPRPVLALISGPKIFSPPQVLSREAIPSMEGPQLEEELAEALREALSKPDPTAQATALRLLVERDRQGTIAALVDAAAKSDQAKRRLQALQLLHQTDQADEETVLGALSQALTDEDINVKGYAIQALAAWEGTDTLEYLRQAFRDPDPTVRILILQQVARQDRGLPWLQEALTDSDEAVRSLASSLVSGQWG